MPQLNAPAPAFEVRTTAGSRTLADYRGRWLVLFSHPADFTPVCTREACMVRDAYDELLGAGLTVAGISPNDRKTHRSFKKKIGIINISCHC